MGKAVITATIGGGLYRIRPLYDLGPLNSELTELNARQVEYSALLIEAFNSLTLLERDVSDASAAKNAVLNQWKQGLIDKLNPVPPVIPPPIENDPETGLPWVDPDRAQEEPLLTLINNLRTAASKPALTRDDDLDDVALTHLRNQAGTKQIGHFGAYQSTPTDRVRAAGYHAESVIEVLSYGTTDPDNVLSEWQKDPDTVTDLLNADATAAGIAYKYSITHPHTYLWCALIVKPGVGPIPTTETTYPPDPIKEATKDTEQSLEKIKPPRTELEIPEKLVESILKYGIAVNKELAARRQIERLMAEKMERDRRIEELETIKTGLLAIEVDAFCCTYTVDMAVGQEVSTLEIPGFYDPAGVARYVEINGLDTLIVERHINIGPFGGSYAASGKLRPTATLQPAMVFYDCALEPGHLRWKPLWRYGTITAVYSAANRCDLTLDAAEARLLPGELDAFSLVPSESVTLTGVPIYYPFCHAVAFDVGADVVVEYEDQDRTKPRVIGFRRSPVSCEGRLSWSQG